MRIVIRVQVVVNVSRIVVAVARTIIGVVVVRANARVVVVSGRRPVMAVRTVDVAPVVAVRQRVNAHVVVGIKGDVRHIVAGVTDEHVIARLYNVEIRRIRRIGVIVNAADVAPVIVSINIIHGMRPVIGDTRDWLNCCDCRRAG